MITNTGKAIIGKYLLGQAPAYASYIAIGCGAKPLDTTDPYGDYSDKQNLDFEMLRIPVSSRGFINDEGTEKIVLTGELPTEERYEITEIGLYSAGSNPAAGAYDSKTIFSFTQGENWQHHTDTAASAIPTITAPLDDPQGDNTIATTDLVFQTNADNAIFFNPTRADRYERARFLNNTIIVRGDDSFLTMGDGLTNLLLPPNNSFETGIGDWVASLNCSIAQSGEEYLVGTKSLKITSIATGRMDAASSTSSSAIDVIEGNSYKASAWFKAEVSAANVRMYIYWFDSSGTNIGNNVSSGTVVDSASSWTERSVIATAPVGAVKAQAVASVITTASGESHYIDKVEFALNSPGPSANHFFIEEGSNHIHLLGADVDFNRNSPIDQLRLAFSIINKDGDSTLSPDIVRILVDFASTDSQVSGEFARFEIELTNGDGTNGTFDFTNNRYYVATKQLQELYQTQGFTWNAVSVAKIYVSAIVGNAPSDQYYVSLDALRLENVSSYNPLYGMTGYSVIKNPDATTIVKSPNTSNYVEFRFSIGVT
jgi:hypothetical protein